MNRRNFLKRLGLAASGVAGAVLLPGALRDEPAAQVAENPQPFWGHVVTRGAPMKVDPGAMAWEESRDGTTTWRVDVVWSDDDTRPEPVYAVSDNRASDTRFYYDGVSYPNLQLAIDASHA